MTTLYPFLINRDLQTSVINDNVLSAIVDYLSDIIDKPVGRTAMDKYFRKANGNSLAQLMMSVSSSKMTKVTIEKIFVLPATLDLMQICFMLQVHALKVITFINKVFTTLEKNPDDQTCKRLAASVVELSDCNYPELYDWLEFLVLGKLEIINFFKDKGYLKFLCFLVPQVSTKARAQRWLHRTTESC